MALYEFSKLVSGPGSASTDYPSNVACVSIREVDRDIAVQNESRLFLARAGKQ